MTRPNTAAAKALRDYADEYATARASLAQHTRDLAILLHSIGQAGAAREADLIMTAALRRLTALEEGCLIHAGRVTAPAPEVCPSTFGRVRCSLAAGHKGGHHYG